MRKRTIWKGPGFLAVEEDGDLSEYCTLDPRNTCGSILLGRIDRMMPGMNCAFVDIGRKKNGFLPLKEDSGSFAGSEFRSGETLILQIKKEETGEKGAYLTRDITLPGELCILMPMNRYTGVSSRIADEGARENLRETGRRIADGRFGLVMRNAAEGADAEAVRHEAETAYTIWQSIQAHAECGGRPGTVLYGGDPLQGLRSDYAARGGADIRVCEELPASLRTQLRQAAERQIRLPGGGNIVIDRCEAMTVIDVNTASAAARCSKERTVTETNLEACEVIARQIRLRNLAGIIIIDFIDMEDKSDQSLVLSKLEECFFTDRVKTVIHGWTHLGLVEMTRKRMGKELN